MGHRNAVHESRTTPRTPQPRNTSFGSGCGIRDAFSRRSSVSVQSMYFFVGFVSLFFFFFVSTAFSFDLESGQYKQRLSTERTAMLFVLFVGCLVSVGDRHASFKIETPIKSRYPSGHVYKWRGTPLVEDARCMYVCATHVTFWFLCQCQYH